MINLSKLSKGTLIRIDDIAENMNWPIMDKIEVLFEKYNIKFINILFDKIEGVLMIEFLF